MSNLSLKDQAAFAKRLSYLAKGGVPLHESILIIAAQSAKKQKALYERIARDISGGRYLSNSLGGIKGLNMLFIETIKAGEESGLFSENLARLSANLEKSIALRRKIVGALVYPICIGIATVILSLFLTMYIFPKIQPLLKTTRTALPLSTKVVLSISEFLKGYGMIALAILAAVIVAAAYILKRNARLKKAFSLSLLRIPIAGPIMRNYHSAAIAHSLGIMTSSGIPLYQALTIAAKNAGAAYRSDLQAIAEQVHAGGQLSAALKRLPLLFPPMMGYMAEVAETAGSLPESLLYVGDGLEAEIDASTKTLTGLVEPVMMAIMGLVVGFIALSIITPLYALTQNIRH